MKWKVHHEYDNQDIRVQKVIINVENDELRLYESWQQYLGSKIQIPFKAKIDEYQHTSSSIKQGDKVEVLNLQSIEELYGIIVDIRFEKKKSYFPLCDLQAIDLDDDGNQALNDYRYWFANR